MKLVTDLGIMLLLKKNGALITDSLTQSFVLPFFATVHLKRKRLRDNISNSPSSSLIKLALQQYSTGKS